MLKTISSNKKGYSIFELVIVLTLIAGIIYVIAVWVWNLYNANKDNGRSLAMNSRVPELLSQYYKATNYYPCTTINTFATDLTAIGSSEVFFQNISDLNRADNGDGQWIWNALKRLNITDANYSNIKKMPNGNEKWYYIADDNNCSAYAICAALETATSESIKSKSTYSLDDNRVLVKTEWEVTDDMKTSISNVCKWNTLRNR